MKPINFEIKDVKIAADKLNSRSRKCWASNTLSVFLQMSDIDARQIGGGAFMMRINLTIAD